MQPEKRKILVVDDQPEIRRAVNQILHNFGYVVIEAENANQALASLNKEKPDIVISDLRMPGMDGIELLNQIRSISDVPFILMTAFAEVMHSTEAHKLGVDGFLLKPFQQKDLIAILEEVPKNRAKKIEVSKSNNISEIDNLYCGIPIGEFEGGKDIIFPIFLKLSDSKYIRIAHVGGDISSEKIVEFQKKEIKFLYLRREDFKEYISFASKAAKEVIENKNLPADRKAIVLRHSSEVILEFGFQQYVDKNIFELAKLNVEQSLSVLTDNIELLDLIESLTSHSTALYAHSMGVALVASLTGRAVGWESSPLFFRLVSSAIFHDLGKRDFPVELQNKHESQMNEQELERWKEHPRLGADYLSKVDDLPAEILQIILHHHELSDGSGFPKGLTSPKIHPVAKVIATADEFYKLYDGVDGKGLDPAEAIAFLEKINEKPRSFPRLEFLAGLKKAFLK